MTNNTRKTWIEPALAYTNVDTIVKRIARDPSVSIGLEDIFPDREYASTFLSLGLGYHLAAHVAARAADEARRVFGSTLDRISWDFFGWFDPVRDLGVDAGLELGPLGLTRRLIRDHFDPSATPCTDYTIDGDHVLSEEELRGVLLAELIFYTVICAQCIAREAAAEVLETSPGAVRGLSPFWDDEGRCEGE